MGRPVAITKNLTASSANNIALSQTPSGAGLVTLNGSAVAGGIAVLDTQRRVLWTSAGNDSGNTLTLIGTNSNKSLIKEVLTGSNGGTAQSALDYKTLISARISGAAGGAITLGTNTVGSSHWVRYDPHLTPPDISFMAQLLTGAASINVEYTYDEFLPSVGAQPDIDYSTGTPQPLAILHPQLQALAGNGDGALNFPFAGWRFTILSGTGTWKVTGTQAGLAGP